MKENLFHLKIIQKEAVKAHLNGVLGGVIWNIGMSMSILASGKAGFAISYGLGQGATLIAALWGVFIWKEFKGASKSVNTLDFSYVYCLPGRIGSAGLCRGTIDVLVYIRSFSKASLLNLNLLSRNSIIS